MKKIFLTLVILLTIAALKDCFAAGQIRVALPVPPKSIDEMKEQSINSYAALYRRAYGQGDKEAEKMIDFASLRMSLADGFKLLQNDIAKCASAAKVAAEKEALPAAPGGPAASPAAAVSEAIG